MSLAEYYPELIRGLPEFQGQFSAHKLAAQDCDVLFATYTAGTKIDPHSHETENIGIITRGELLLTIDGETQRITAGNWYHVPAGKQHAAEFPADTAEIEFWFYSQAGTDNARSIE